MEARPAHSDSASPLLTVIVPTPPGTAAHQQRPHLALRTPGLPVLEPCAQSSTKPRLGTVVLPHAARGTWSIRRPDSARMPPPVPPHTAAMPSACGISQVAHAGVVAAVRRDISRVGHTSGPRATLARRKHCAYADRSQSERANDSTRRSGHTAQTDLMTAQQAPVGPGPTSNRPSTEGLCERVVVAELEHQVQAATVSVIMPIFNRPQFLVQAVRSIRHQSHAAVQIILVDDGSNPETASLIRDQARADSRIVVVRQCHAGAGAARNRGLDEATGDYCMFLDSDDWCEDSTVAKLLREALVNASDIVACDARCWNHRLNSWGMDYEQSLPDGVDPHCFRAVDLGEAAFSFAGTSVWRKFYRTEFLRNSGIKFQSLPNSNDVYFNAMTIASARRISSLPEKLIVYRTRTETSLQDLKSTREGLTWLKAMRTVCDDLHSRNLWHDLRHAFARELLSHLEYNLRTAPTPEMATLIWNSTVFPCGLDEWVSSFDTHLRVEDLDNVKLRRFALGLRSGATLDETRSWLASDRTAPMALLRRAEADPRDKPAVDASSAARPHGRHVIARGLTHLRRVIGPISQQDSIP